LTDLGGVSSGGGQHPGQVNGGHFLVNWQTYLRPKKWGRLGLKDLEKFSRALRLGFGTNGTPKKGLGRNF
jgi:hypothetical protein